MLFGTYQADDGRGTESLSFPGKEKAHWEWDCRCDAAGAGGESGDIGARMASTRYLTGWIEYAPLALGGAAVVTGGGARSGDADAGATASRVMRDDSSLATGRIPMDVVTVTEARQRGRRRGSAIQIAWIGISIAPKHGLAHGSGASKDPRCTITALLAPGILGSTAVNAGNIKVANMSHRSPACAQALRINRDQVRSR
ncbi:uncharacterized protein FIBRA_09138 [Fibroporia radiculosa]|uniref:Uncharacterized protein n=1 Tax=Fibroporia radiculosa TaxID=599839 RepID=J4GY06_9APHY|nr:uncharacterized protein FIBRA_09138 [Fibroporia radiculosa]CCM06835.1 predicted protein [Fibroporia radiculosa]